MKSTIISWHGSFSDSSLLHKDIRKSIEETESSSDDDGHSVFQVPWAFSPIVKCLSPLPPSPACFAQKQSSLVRAVPDEKIWGSLKAKLYIFVEMVGGGCFFNTVDDCLLWNCKLQVVVLLRNVFLWVSFVQMGSCGLFGFKYKEEEENKLFQFFRRGFPEKQEFCGWCSCLIICLNSN